MVCACRWILLAAVVLLLGVELSGAQHWSHGWYPGGKRDVDAFNSAQISEEIKLCEAGECSYLRPQRRNILKSILLPHLTIPLTQNH
ncbi:hypothetical protein ACEWY4_016714 [Coilia grayii]|uniref:Progonadoliberin n=1 Tax=Coilia grayii TaxID=363190 RepID=A0ABD1JMC2_9TELE